MQETMKKEGTPGLVRVAVIQDGDNCFIRETHRDGTAIYNKTLAQIRQCLEQQLNKSITIIVDEWVTISGDNQLEKYRPNARTKNALIDCGVRFESSGSDAKKTDHIIGERLSARRHFKHDVRVVVLISADGDFTRFVKAFQQNHPDKRLLLIGRRHMSAPLRSAVGVDRVAGHWEDIVNDTTTTTNKTQFKLNTGMSAERPNGFAADVEQPNVIIEVEQHSSTAMAKPRHEARVSTGAAAINENSMNDRKYSTRQAANKSKMNDRVGQASRVTADLAAVGAVFKELEQTQQVLLMVFLTMCCLTHRDPRTAAWVTATDVGQTWRRHDAFAYEAGALREQAQTAMDLGLLHDKNGGTPHRQLRLTSLGSRWLNSFLCNYRGRHPILQQCMQAIKTSLTNITSRCDAPPPTIGKLGTANEGVVSVEVEASVSYWFRQYPELVPRLVRMLPAAEGRLWTRLALCLEAWSGQVRVKVAAECANRRRVAALLRRVVAMVKVHGVVDVPLEEHGEAIALGRTWGRDEGMLVYAEKISGLVYVVYVPGLTRDAALEGLCRELDY